MIHPKRLFGRLKLIFVRIPIAYQMLPQVKVTSKYFGPGTRSRKRAVEISSTQQHFSKTNEKVYANTSIDVAKKKLGGDKKKPKVTAGNKPKLAVQWEPTQWSIQLDNIRTMRKERNAPVDIMGCEKCTQDGYSEKEKRYHLLTSLMLSSQTKDQTTHAAMNRLINNELTVDSIVSISEKRLGELIYPVSFWKTKVGHIKRTAAILKEEYDCDIPSTVEQLVKLPGVGPKMAYLTMTCAWDKVVGIGVDVHVHRISNRLGWVRKRTTNPEATRKELEDWLPRELWREVNWLLVGFGQQVCLPTSPKCSTCLNNQVCPAAKGNSKK